MNDVLLKTSAAPVSRATRAPAPAAGVLPMPWFKRGIDVMLSSIGLVLSSPLWVLIPAAIKLEDGGPIFFAQERVGEGLRVFKAMKFRSMIPHAEREFGALQATERDPRITRIGRLMRATAMDELPQLLNILRGDMSFVGPRALRPHEIETGGAGQLVSMEDIPGYVERHMVRPGLTGIAQVFAPRDVPRRYKFKYDLIYIHNRSVRLDAWLILVSFWITFRGKWEHRGRKV